MFYKLQFKIHASALLSVDILHDLQCLCYYHSLDSFIHSTYAIESLFHLRLAARVTTTHRYTFHVCIYILRSRDEPRLDFAVATERMEIAWYATMDFVVARESGKRGLVLPSYSFSWLSPVLLRKRTEHLSSRCDLRTLLASGVAVEASTR